ncbi:PREDICTED: DNA-dependent protein kinase catalytic subunit-like, partial [Rhagoletis zephyria]|uniref:DNA-dependent protein kinase catalytic subunit-like n=1 Tax=Rhagoletis zephyria TaxID=28612 RepID=UPI00081148A7
FSHLPNSRLIRPARATGSSNNKYDDVPEFDRKQVSLDFPDELFNKSFATLTNISKSFSRLIMNSARRYSRFVLFFKPIFGDALVVKGWEDPTTTTTTPRSTTTTTATSSNSFDKQNEV